MPGSCFGTSQVRGVSRGTCPATTPVVPLALIAGHRFALGADSF